MSKAICSKCGFEVLLEEKEVWSIKDTIKYLTNKMKEHKCKLNTEIK